MKVAEVSCPHCRVKVIVKLERLTYFVCAEDPRWSHTTFVCPDCGNDVIAPVSVKAHYVLLTLDVKQVPYSPPAEAFERHEGAPLNTDDLLDLLNDIKQFEQTGVVE